MQKPAPEPTYRIITSPMSGHFFHRLSHLIWPPLSLLGDDPVDRPGLIHAEAWARLTFVTEPVCAICGFVFATAPEEWAGDTRCLSCVATPPAFDHARAVFFYDEPSRGLPLALKHSGRLDGLATFAALMANALTISATGAQGGPGPDLPDVLIPVPLHPFRLWRRGYNQAGLLAAALGRRLDRPVRHDALIRRRATIRQAGLTPAGRRDNVTGAFRVRQQAFAVKGKSVLLVDDVFTTGATLEACAGVLKRAGARRVCAVTLARVMRPRPKLARPKLAPPNPARPKPAQPYLTEPPRPDLDASG